MNNKWLSISIEQVAEELNEIMRSKVTAMNGNCIMGYRIEIVNVIEEYTFQGQAILVAISAIGDALEVGTEVVNETAKNSDDSVTEIKLHKMSSSPKSKH